MADLRANARAGDGQSATRSSLPIVVPAGAVAGDVAVLEVDSGSDTVTLSTPAGWTLLFGPDRVGQDAGTGWLFLKALGGGDPGATVTLSFSKSQRCIAEMSVYRDVTATGWQAARRVEYSSAGTTTLPSLGSVAAGSLVHVAWLRRFAGTVAANVSAPAEYLQGTGSRVATAYGSPSEFSIEVGYQAAPEAGTYGGETASVSSSSIGVNYLVALRGVVSDVTVEGATAFASVESLAGTVSNGGVVVEGAPATATVTSLAGVTSGAVEVLASALEWPPEPYREAIRNGLAIYYTIDAEFGGQSVTGAIGLQPTGGTIVDTARPGARWTLNLELADPTGELFTRLAPSGTRLTATAHLRYTHRAEQTIPMGVYVVDAETLSESSGQLSVTAPDKWSIIQRAKFLKPQAATRGARIVDQIATLIRGALGASEAVVINATSNAKVAALTWDRDRDQAIIDLAAEIGAWVFFDRDGVATIADTPRAGAVAKWLIDASASGVLIDLDRELSRTDAANVVSVESSSAADAAFPTVFVWDADPNSATYAGPDPVNSPELAGPFGVVPVFESSPNLASQAEAIEFGGSVLARTTGLLSQVSLEEVPNPALEAFDVFDVLPPGQEKTGVRALDGFGVGAFGESAFGSASLFEVTYRPTREVERHIADTVTHPLTVGPAQRIEGRATNVTALIDNGGGDTGGGGGGGGDTGGGGGGGGGDPTATLFGYNGDAGQYSVATRMGWWGRAPIVRKFRSSFVPATFEYTTTQCPEKRVAASFKPDGTFTASVIASGGANARFTSWLESIPAGWTVYATYFHEPNDEIRAGTLSVANYRGAWPQLRAALNSASLNTGVTVKLAPCFISYRLTDAGRWSDSWVPDRASFDTLTFDMYGNPGELGGGPSGTNRYGTATGTQYGTLYPPPEVYLQPVMDIISRLGWSQHWGVLEINSPQRSWDPNESARARWFKETYDFLLSRPYKPELVTLWENVAQYDHTFGRLSGSPTVMANALRPYITGSP